MRNHTSFRTGGLARFFVEVETREELREIVQKIVKDRDRYVVLGEGTNVLFSDHGFDGWVVKPKILGLEFISRKVFAAAGENWDEFVDRTVSEGFSGLENLSLIPGSVGAAPVQNIGAYGVEVGSSIVDVEVYDPESDEFKMISADKCRFGYRESFFKTDAGKRLIIVGIVFELNPGSRPDIGYRDLRNYFAESRSTPTARSVRQAVIEIRRRKLPDVSVVGTAGSFFKNPVVSGDFYAELLHRYPGLPSFDAGNGNRKIPLAWLLDKVLKAKGLRKGDVGLYENQPLAVVNFGGATTQEIKIFAEEISEKIKNEFGLEIQSEVNLIGDF